MTTVDQKVDETKLEVEIREFLSENFMLDDAAAGIGEDDSLTAAGVLDSMGVLELITFIEEKYGLHVPDEDTLPENLDSVARVRRYVARRLAES